MWWGSTRQLAKWESVCEMQVIGGKGEGNKEDIPEDVWVVMVGVGVVGVRAREVETYGETCSTFHFK